MAKFVIGSFALWRNWQKFSRLIGEGRVQAVVTGLATLFRGAPFELAEPEQGFNFLGDRGFTLVGLKTCAGVYGRDERLFARSRAP